LQDLAETEAGLSEAFMKAGPIFDWIAEAWLVAVVNPSLLQGAF
jgi:hypothetical protein